MKDAFLEIGPRERLRMTTVSSDWPVPSSNTTAAARQ